mgnify:CR=1 FL=1
MNDRPTTTELLAAAERFLEESAVPALDGPAKYHARVAANVVRIVARELACEDEHVAHEWDGLATLLGDAPKPAARDALHAAIRARNEALVRRIRAGEAAWRRARMREISHAAITQPSRPGIIRKSSKRSTLMSMRPA